MAQALLSKQKLEICIYQKCYEYSIEYMYVCTICKTLQMKQGDAGNANINKYANVYFWNTRKKPFIRSV